MRCSSSSWPAYVIPPINRAMTTSPGAIRTEFAELTRPSGSPQGRGGAQGADRQCPPRSGQDPRGGPRTGADRRAARAGPGRSCLDRRACPCADRRRAPRRMATLRAEVSPGHGARRADRRGEVSRTTSGVHASPTGSWLTRTPETSRRTPPRTGRADVAGASAEALTGLSEKLEVLDTLADQAKTGEELFGVSPILRPTPHLAGSSPTARSTPRPAPQESNFGSAVGERTLKIVADGHPPMDRGGRPARRPRAPGGRQHRPFGRQGRRQVGDELFAVRRIINGNPDSAPAL